MSTETTTFADRAVAATELVERVLTAHWDLAACFCPFCKAAHAAGFGARSEYLSGIHDWWEQVAHANEPPSMRSNQ